MALYFYFLSKNISPNYGEIVHFFYKLIDTTLLLFVFYFWHGIA